MSYSIGEMVAEVRTRARAPAIRTPLVSDEKTPIEKLDLLRVFAESALRRDPGALAVWDGLVLNRNDLQKGFPEQGGTTKDEEEKDEEDGVKDKVTESKRRSFINLQRR